MSTLSLTSKRKRGAGTGLRADLSGQGPEFRLAIVLIFPINHSWNSTSLLQMGLGTEAFNLALCKEGRWAQLLGIGAQLGREEEKREGGEKEREGRKEGEWRTGVGEGRWNKVKEEKGRGQEKGEEREGKGKDMRQGHQQTKARSILAATTTKAIKPNRI